MPVDSVAVSDDEEAARVLLERSRSLAERAAHRHADGNVGGNVGVGVALSSSASASVSAGVSPSPLPAPATEQRRRVTLQVVSPRGVGHSTHAESRSPPQADDVALHHADSAPEPLHAPPTRSVASPPRTVSASNAQRADDAMGKLEQQHGKLLGQFDKQREAMRQRHELQRERLRAEFEKRKQRIGKKSALGTQLSALKSTLQSQSRYSEADQLMRMASQIEEREQEEQRQLLERDFQQQLSDLNVQHAEELRELDTKQAAALESFGQQLTRVRDVRSAAPAAPVADGNARSSLPGIARGHTAGARPRAASPTVRLAGNAPVGTTAAPAQSRARSVPSLDRPLSSVVRAAADGPGAAAPPGRAISFARSNNTASSGLVGGTRTTSPVRSSAASAASSTGSTSGAASRARSAYAGSPSRGRNATSAVMSRTRTSPSPYGLQSTAPARVGAGGGHDERVDGVSRTLQASRVETDSSGTLDLRVRNPRMRVERSAVPGGGGIAASSPPQDDDRARQLQRELARARELAESEAAARVVAEDQARRASVEVNSVRQVMLREIREVRRRQTEAEDGQKRSQVEVRNLRGQVEVLRESNHKKTMKLVELERENRLYSEKVQDLRSQVQQLKTENVAMTSKVTELRAENATIRRERDQSIQKLGEETKQRKWLEATLHELEEQQQRLSGTNVARRTGDAVAGAAASSGDASSVFVTQQDGETGAVAEQRGLNAKVLCKAIVGGAGLLVAEPPTELEFSATLVGETQRIAMSLVNVCGTPIVYEWAMPAAVRHVFSVNPASGVLLEDEKIELELSFLPDRPQTFSVSADCELRSIALGTRAQGRVRIWGSGKARVAK